MLTENQLYSHVRDIPRSHLPPYEAVAENLGLPLDIAESKKGEDYWQITYYLSDEKEQFLAAMAVADAVSGAENTQTDIRPVVGDDWEWKTVNSFKPLILGRFFIHRYDEEVPANKVGIKIPAGMAFGTGEHPSTAECLNLLEKLILSENVEIKNILDMGCGSGILSIAALKTIPKSRATGIDIDPDSITVCEENLKNNNVLDRMTCAVSDGFGEETIAVKNAPYDLIFANMTANPVMKFAPDFSEHIQKDGLIFISGYLDFQAEQVHRTYLDNGFEMVDHYTSNDRDDVWIVAAFQKK